jgi:6-phosphogluconolactonase
MSHSPADLPPPVADVPSAFTQVVQQAFVDRIGPRFTLVLSGGPTAQACYENLAAATATATATANTATTTTTGTATATIEWPLVDVYMGDERVVGPDDPDANQRLVRDALLDRVGPVGSFTPMPTLGPVEQCVASYQATMRQLLAGPGIDLIHLGLGPDGHTASLFPGAPTLQAGPDELVAATEDPNGRNPHPRMTLTLPAINSARCAVFTVSGAAKQEAVAAVRDGKDIPATRVEADRVVWLVDGPASGQRP